MAKALLLLALLGGSASAQDSATKAPPPPLPDDFDWVQLTSLEWLKGDIIAFYRNELEFDSDKLGIRKLKWQDIKYIRSGRPMEVSLRGGTIIVGKILLDDDALRVLGDEEEHYARSDIVSISPRASSEIHNWDIKVGVGGNYRQGNTEQVETTVIAEVARRTAKTRVRVDYLASFNETDGQTAADNQRATAVWNRYLQPHLYLTPLFGEWFRDPFQNIASRWTLGAGLGYQLGDTPRTSWELGVGPAFQRTQFEDVEKDSPTSSTTLALVGTTSYEYELTRWTDFDFEYRFFVVNEESGTYTHHLVTGVEIEVTSLIDLDVTLVWDRIQTPQPASDGTVPKQDDLRIVLSLGFEF